MRRYLFNATSAVKTKLLPPWIIHAKMIEALFGDDLEIECRIISSSEDPTVTLFCTNGDKVTALKKILPEKMSYGNVVLNIVVDGVPSNRAFKNNKELYDTAFANNPVYAYSVRPADYDDYEWFDVTYVVFKNRVVQFFADNLKDCHGVMSTLYQDIADSVIFFHDGVYFNTDVEEGSEHFVGRPLGEWP